MKRLICCILIMVFLFVFVSCGHEHEWIEATCTAPKTCKICQKTEGEPLGHTWKEATCTMPKTCSRCGLTEGSSLGHSLNESTCTEPKTCTRCGIKIGEAKGHNVPGHSCTEGGICKRCGEEIPPLGHNWEDATCKDPKTCSRCGLTEGDPLGHKPSQPKKENAKPATCTEAGTYDEVISCLLCNEEISREKKTEAPLGHTTDNGICERCGIEIYKTVTGSGDDVVSDINVGNGIYRVHFTNSGRSNFIVHVYDSTDDRDLAVNNIGNYDGYYLLTGSAPYTFEIESKGKWSYTIERLTKTDQTSFSGHGSYVTDFFEATTGAWHITHDGSRNFIVRLHTDDGRDLIINDIGKYDGRKLFSIPSSGLAFLEIEADGNWSFTPD